MNYKDLPAAIRNAIHEHNNRNTSQDDYDSSYYENLVHSRISDENWRQFNTKESCETTSEQQT